MPSRRSFLSQSIAAASLGTPALSLSEQRFRVPPEEARHQMTLMQWPVDRYTYPKRADRDAIQAVIARIANTIAAFEPVIMLAAKRHHKAARVQLSDNVTLWDIPTDDLWCRDSGPLFGITQSGDLAVSHIQFNGWGRYPLPEDERISQRVARHMGLELLDSQLVGEPGGAETNGHGLVMANASSWINDNRNPGLTNAEVSERLGRAYGADRVIWGPGVKGLDITDAHIDGMARFTAPNRVIMQLDDDHNNDPYNAAATTLLKTLGSEGINVETIPYTYEGRIPETCYHVNFYVCNGAVIMSEFGDEKVDALALNMVKRHYPDREVIALNTDLLIQLGGGIHCATQQVPAT